MGILAGGVTSPVIGYIKDTTGSYQGGLYFLSVLAALGALVIIAGVSSAQGPPPGFRGPQDTQPPPPPVVFKKRCSNCNRVVSSDSLGRAVNTCAQSIAAKSPLAVRLGKRAVREQAGMSLADAYEHASQVMVENMLSADAAEGIAAFFDKRKPSWRGE